MNANPKSIQPDCHLYDHEINWLPFAGIENLELSLLDIDEERSVVDLIVRFAPNKTVTTQTIIMDETKDLVKKITEGIQEKKGRNIVIADLTNIEDTICKYFVICQGNSPSQVGAIVDSIKEFTRKGADSKPFAVDGLRNAEWVAMDYADVLVHVFLPETRAFYNLEHLWADAKLIQIPDLD